MINSTGSATLSVGGNNASSTFTGSLQNGGGSLALVKTGSGTLTLAAATYSGGTTVDGGTLQLSVGGGSAGTLAGNAPITVNSGAILLGGATDALGYFNNLSNAVNLNEGGTLSVVAGSRLSMDRTINSVGGAITSSGSGDATGSTYTLRNTYGANTISPRPATAPPRPSAPPTSDSSAPSPST